MRKIFIGIVLWAATAACKEKYDLPYTGPAAGYLVVDGVINSGQGPTSFRITRTVALVDSVNIRNEVLAHVEVEGEDNSHQVLSETSPGLYRADQLTLQDGVKYRLRIQTDDGKVYLSDYRPARKTPAIDSLPWERTDDGLTLFVNTHDPQNNTHYYRWEFEETWEFHSSFWSLIRYEYDGPDRVIDVDPRPASEAEKMYKCWQSSRSTAILIGSSTKLSRDTIHLPFHFIERPSWKLSVLYSILVRQYAISREGYEFLQRMKKNTEQVGTLFDAQPSELVGNIRCESDPSEPVIGFVEVTEAKEKRIFIRNAEVAPWVYSTGCQQLNVPNDPDSLTEWRAMMPTDVSELSMRGDTLRIFIAAPVCVDCTMRGTNTKPDFWP